MKFIVSRGTMTLVMGIMQTMLGIKDCIIEHFI